MERKLASIQRIESLKPIAKADAIECARVLGWDVVVKKGEFQPGDLCVYFEIDSMIPQDVPELAFMANARWRVKTIKLRGQLSQGLALPVSTFPWLRLTDNPIDTDVSSMIGSGVTKWEPDIHPSLSGEARGSFPGFLRKTDEPRIQSCAGLLRRHADALWYATEKLDGTSFTAYWYREDFGVCSRNLNLKPESVNGNDTRNVHWRVANRLDLAETLPKLCVAYGRDLAIQGEVVGPRIQGNKYGLEEPTLFLFGVYDIERAEFLDLPDLVNMSASLGVKHVPMIANHIDLGGSTVNDLVRSAEGKSRLADTQREGLVYRTTQYRADDRAGHASFKAINNKFLLKHGE